MQKKDAISIPDCGFACPAITTQAMMVTQRPLKKSSHYKKPYPDEEEDNKAGSDKRTNTTKESQTVELFRTPYKTL